MSLTLDLSQKPAPATPKKHDLVGREPGEIAALLTESGLGEKEARMRARQLWNWIYVNGATDFAAMTNIAKPMREALAAGFSVQRPEIVSEQVSSDGTRKWLFRFTDPETPNAPPVDVETVYIPEEDRGTLCVSSQVGCTLTCSFCHTGTQRLVRNLTAGEILSQILAARDQLGDFPEASGRRRAGAGGRDARHHQYRHDGHG